ncbi:hypothetical protein QAD02_024449 [Eretmocerus hayati]|uniref:Uncharacterized protein n=1 Tax=Eretmocerus hayati TaxID=131215 RepID=A0ACC2Q1B3_9HYME|nr:hypothetical protein QAD02_024449 [Eretmocerus hayati]
MGDPAAKIINNAENSRKIIVVANGQKQLLTVPGNYVEQSFLLSEFGRGRLVYKLSDVKPKSSQDSNENGIIDNYPVDEKTVGMLYSDGTRIFLEEDVDIYYFEHMGTESAKLDRLSHMRALIQKHQEMTNAKKRSCASDSRLMNNECSNENKSPNKREKSDSSNVGTCTPNKNFSSSKHNKSPHVRRVIYACCLYKESSSAVFLLRGGISNVIEVNGNIDYSINDLIEILKIELGKIDEIQDLNFSDEKHTFQLGFRDSTCIHEFRDKQGNPCDFWTWAKKYRTSRHELKMALLVAEKVEKEGDSRKSDELFDDHLCANTSGSSAPARNLRPEYFPPPLGDVEEYIEPSTVHLNSNALKAESSTCTTPSTLSRSDALLNGFRVEESEINFSNITLGGGLQGTVTQGRYRMKDVAIKSIPRGKFDFLSKREVVNLIKLSDENIIKFKAWCETATQIHIIMELFHGVTVWQVTMDEKVRKEYKFKEIAKNYAGKQIVSGLAACHLLKPCPIIHRDLKPANVMIDKFFTIKICDFGFSKSDSSNQSIVSSVGTNSYGTFTYMPPEVLVSNEEATTSGDIWSLACTLIEMYSESCLWGEKGNANMIAVKKLGSGEIPDYVNNPIFLWEIVKQSLSYDPTFRPGIDKYVEVFDKQMEPHEINPNLIIALATDDGPLDGIDVEASEV